MTTVTVYCARPGDYRVSIDDGDGQIIDLAPWPLRRHAESHARRIRAALDWRPADGDPQVAHTAAQDERIARLEAENAELREREQEALEQRVAALRVDPPENRPRRPWVSRHAALVSELATGDEEHICPTCGPGVSCGGCAP